MLLPTGPRAVRTVQPRKPPVRSHHRGTCDVVAVQQSSRESPAPRALILLQDASEGVEVWDSSVRYFRVKSADTGKPIAGFFLDPCVC